MGLAKLRITISVLCLMSVITVRGQVTGIDYEKVLLPDVVNVAQPGSLGSLWITRLTVTNSADRDVDEYYGTLYDSQIHQGVETCCLPLPAKSTVEVSTLQDDPGTRGRGVFYFFDRRFTDQVQISLRVQDLSRQSQTWGTALPVVRERQFVNRTVTLNDVRIDATSRLAVRAYSLDSRVRTRVRLSIYASGAGLLANTPPDVLLGSQEFDFRTYSYTPIADNPFPGFLEVSRLDTIASVAGYDRVRVDVTPLDASRIWAFASITNNETQHVTIIAPSP